MLNALNEPDLYRFFCLSLYRNIYYNVRLRIEDIAKITGEKKGVLKNFNKSMDTVLTRKKYPSPINHPVYEFTMRSLYKIPAMDYKGFITLSHKFTQVKLSVKVKGYYIKLLLIAENNTIPLTNIEIANKLGISKNTVFKYNIELFQAGLLKLFPDRLELTPNELLISNDEAKQKGGQNVHGLVAGLDAGGGHVLHQGLVPHRADGGDHTHHNEDQQADEQGGGEDFAHDVHHRPLPHAKQQDQQEEEHREEDGAHTGDQGSHRGLKGGGGGPGNGQHGTDAQHDGAHQQHGRDLPNAGGDLFRAALPENSEHRQQSQADVRDVVADEAQQPMGAGLQPQVGGEDHVPRPKKHGKQSKANDETVLQWFLHREPPFLR